MSTTAVATEVRTAVLDSSKVAGRTFTGHAAIFNAPTDIGDPLRFGFVEQIAPGAFAESLRSDDVLQLADHDPAKPIARTSMGTLRLSEDRRGLAVTSELVRTGYADDLIANIKAGNVKGMSFGFTVPTGGDSWTTETCQTPKGPVTVDVRTLRKVNLIEVSTTAFPAYGDTDAAVRQARSRHSRRAPAGGPNRSRMGWRPIDLDLRMVALRVGLRP